MMIRATYPLFVLLLLVGAACTDPPESEADLAAGTTAAADTAALRQIYSDIDAQHDQIMRRYRERSAQLPPEAHQRYQQMEQMHGQMRPMHQQMMRGQMHHDGMMGRGQRGAMGPMRELRDQDQQMRTMHEEMAAYLREQGYDEMADLHEQMTRHYNRALDALPETPPGQE